MTKAIGLNSSRELLAVCSEHFLRLSVKPAMANRMITLSRHLIWVMKKVAALGAMVLLWCFGVPGADSFVGGDGERYDLGQWSPPQTISLASVTGQVAGIRTTIGITNRHDNIYTVENISVPALQALWMGAGYSNHFAFGKIIYGARMYAHDLLIKPSKRVDNPDRVDEVATQAFARLLSTNSNLWGGSDAAYRFDLLYIFGDKPFNPRDARGPGPIAITGVTTSDNSVTFGLQTTSFRTGLHNQLTLTFNSEFQLASASVNGKPVTFLRDGRIPMGEMMDWGPPRQTQLITPEGVLTAYRCGTTLYSGSPEVFRKSTMQAVVLPDGRLWAGPLHCWLASGKDRVIGVTVDRPNRKLLFYDQVRARIPLSSDQTCEAFRNAVLAFQADCISGRFKETASLGIPDLFPNDASLAHDPDLGVRDIQFDGSDLTVVLNTNNAQMQLRVTVGPDYMVKSALQATPIRGNHRAPWSIDF